MAQKKYQKQKINSVKKQRLPQYVNDAVRRYINVVRQEVPVERVILYGSLVNGNANKKSDIDIAVISRSFGKDPHEEGKFLFRKLWDVEYANIDPVPYSPGDFNTKIPSPLLREIRKYGREIRV